MKTVLIVLFVLISSYAIAQTRENVWYDAALILMDGDSLKGEANYNIRDHIVQVIVDEKVYSYSESQVKDMKLSDGENYHHFMLIALNNEFGRVELKLVEMIYQSEAHYSFVRRHQADKRAFRAKPTLANLTSLNNVPMTNRTLRTKEEVRANADKDSFTSKYKVLSRRDFKEWLVNYEGVSVVLSRKGLFEALADKKKEIKKYMSENKLSVTNDIHMIRILREYDRLKSQD